MAMHLRSVFVQCLFLTNRRVLPRRFPRIHDGSREATEADTQSRHTTPPSFCTSHWLSQLLPT